MTVRKLVLILLFGVFLIYIGGVSAWYGSPDPAKDLGARVVGAVFGLFGVLFVTVCGYQLWKHVLQPVLWRLRRPRR